MPKRPSLSDKKMIDPLASTLAEQPGQAPAADDPIKPKGIGLRASEWEHFNAIARELGEKPHALAMWVVRDFMRRWDAGEIKLETKRTLPGL